MQINLPFLGDLKRSPTPKLGDLRPKVEGNVCVNSLASKVWPASDLNRLSFEKEMLAFVGEKLTCSCVKSRHLCLPELDSVMKFFGLKGSMSIFYRVQRIALFLLYWLIKYHLFEWNIKIEMLKSDFNHEKRIWEHLYLMTPTFSLPLSDLLLRF